MSEIPCISVTQEDVDSDDASDECDADYNISNALTDVEDLLSGDEATDTTDLTKDRIKIQTKTIPIKGPSGAVTDVEDYNDSGSEDEKSENIPEMKFSLDEFLDQGYMHEATQVSDQVTSRTGKKILKGNFLSTLSFDDPGCVTDYENVDTSDDEAKAQENPIRLVPVEEVERNLYESGKVTISDSIADQIVKTIKRRKAIKKRKPVDDNQVSINDEVSDAEEAYDDNVNQDGISDVEAISDIEDCAGACGPPVPVDNVEEFMIEISDDDIDTAMNYPVIDIIFEPVNELGHCGKRSDSIVSQSKSSIREPVECLTDVERLDDDCDDDDDDDDDDDEIMNDIPRARACISPFSSVTDVEDIDLGDLAGLTVDAQPVSHTNIPAPLREIIIVKEGETGGRITSSMPLQGTFQIGIDNSHINKGLTDTEEVSGTEEDYYGTLISDNIPTIEVDNAIVQNSEGLKCASIKKRNDLINVEPITDTEEIFITGNVRRKKLKSRTQNKPKSRLLTLQQDAQSEGAKTDVEELEISDIDSSQKPLVDNGIKLLRVSPLNTEGVTDTEYITGDEDYNDDNAGSVSDVDQISEADILTKESFYSTITQIDSLSSGDVNPRRAKSPNLLLHTHLIGTGPISQCATDVEDVQLQSDIDDAQDMYTRANTISPNEMHAALNEGSVSIIHETCGSTFNIDKEKNHIKGLREITEFHTDVESLDEETVQEKKDVEGNSEEDITQTIKDGSFDEPQISERTKGEECDYLLHTEATTLVDSILEQSIIIVNAQQQCYNATDYNSESENYAITCDINGVDMVKSPTIESMSGKSFDDNMSVNDDFNLIMIPSCTTTTTCNNATSSSSVINQNNILIDPINDNIINTTSSSSTTTMITTPVTSQSTIMPEQIEILTINNHNNNINNSINNTNNHNNMNINNIDMDDINNINSDIIQNDVVNNDNNSQRSIKNVDRIERKFERLSSQLDDLDESASRFETDFRSLSKDEISNLQSDFSKISWDESVSGTTTAADVGLSTPDNDLQDLPTEPGSRTAQPETDIPKPTPRLSKTIASDVSFKEDIESIRSESLKDIEQSSSISDMKETIVQQVDYKQSKKFWESIESSTTSHSEPKSSHIPVPKPRSQMKTVTTTTTTTTTSNNMIQQQQQKTDDSISSIRDSSLDSNISSEQQVEYSETSSVHTSLIDDKYELKEEDSIASDLKLDEILPAPTISDIDKLPVDDSSKVQTDILEAPASQQDDISPSKQASFYIGESSTNIITKSSSEKRNSYAFDNEGYEDTFDEGREMPQDDGDIKPKTLTEIESDDKIQFDSKSSDQAKIDSEQVHDEFTEYTGLTEMPPEVLKLKLDDDSTEYKRQDSETRNDILEIGLDQPSESEKDTKSVVIPKHEEPEDLIQIEEIHPEQVIHKDLVTHYVVLEDQTIPMEQEAVQEEVPIHVAEVLESQVMEEYDKHEQIEEKQFVVTREVYTVEVVHSQDGEMFVSQKEVHPSDVSADEKKEIKRDQYKQEHPYDTHIEESIEAQEQFLVTHKQPLQETNLPSSTTEGVDDQHSSSSATTTAPTIPPLPEKSDHKVKFETKLELNLDKSELELSEKSFSKTKHSDRDDDQRIVFSPVKPFKGFTTYQETTKDDFKKTLLIDPSQVDQSIVDQTLDEVKQSLDAVGEELIEVVKDGKLIKQSPSEFEFTLLPHIKYTNEPIQESFHEEISTTTSTTTSSAATAAITTTTTTSTSIISETHTSKSIDSKKDILDSFTLKSELEETINKDSEDSIQYSSQPEEYPSLSSVEDTSSRLEVVHRVRREHKTDKNRWSVPEIDHSSSGDSHYQSFEKSDVSRPCSSDVENLLTYGNSSEYQTAHDASLLPESTEYVSAVSTFDHSGKTISSHESMKSLDSESSANLGSIEISEISETLVPSSIGDPDIESDGHDDDFDADDSDMKLSTLEDKFCGVLMEDIKKPDDHIPSQMKRSQEMTFQPEQILDSPDASDEAKVIPKFSTSFEESRILDDTKFPSSLEDGSVLSMSLSSASCVDTVVENVEDLAGSLGASSLAGADLQSLIRDDYTGTSFEEPSLTDKIDSMVMTSSLGKDEDTNYANTQITTVTVAAETTDSEPKRAKGHKRNESAAFTPSDFLPGVTGGDGSVPASKEKKVDSPLEEEPSIIEQKYDVEGKKESESESDYDAYESEYSRAFKSPTTQRKPKEKHVETFEKDQEPEKRPFTPSQSVSEIIVEDATEEMEYVITAGELDRRPSQNMYDYSKVPEIMITEDLKKYSEDGVEEPPEIDLDAEIEPDLEAEAEDEFQDNVLYKAKTQEELHKVADAPMHYAQEHEYTESEGQYQDMIVQQPFERNIATVTTSFKAEEDDDDKADSPDSFEMLEQPDISDEFVIIEEVAKEADEFDTEGKSINIKTVKYVKKHDEEVEQLFVRSAPAAPNEGSAMYAREDLNFEFEESPPTGQDTEGTEAVDVAAANKKWVEMQISDNAGHLRYPYEMERGILEDIKEEDTDFEVGSSRISSFKDSFSSTPEYDVLAGKKYFTREHDDVSMSSLQEFESLEHAISLENRRVHQGSQDSLSNGSFTRRYLMRCGGQGDDISLSSLKEFEGLENACIEAHLIEIKAKEEAAQLLSRSDESNKSANGDAKSTSGPSTTVTTVTTSVMKSSGMTTTTSPPFNNIITGIGSDKSLLSKQDIELLIKAKLEECEEESSNLMEVSTDSLEIGMKKSKSQNGGTGREDSQLGSCDSLEINKSIGDIMTSSIDSFEISKDATARSSRSDVDSLEQQILQDVRRDSIDSIELEYALQVAAKSDKDSLEESLKGFGTTSTATTAAAIITTSSTSSIMTATTTAGDTISSSSSSIQTFVQTTTTTTTKSSSSITGGTSASSSQHEMIKDFSSDSLNLNQTDPDLLLTSTESLADHTSSTATNATYQNENDSQMSGSMTSCGSNTMIDTLESNFSDVYPGAASSQFLYEEGKLFSATTKEDPEKRYEYFEIFDKDFEKLDTNQTESGEEAPSQSPQKPDTHQEK